MSPVRKFQSIIRICVTFVLVAGSLFTKNAVHAQAVSPFQTGAYMTAFSNVRDMAAAPPGFFVLMYNYYAFTDTYVDKDGTKFNSFPLDMLDPGLPEDVDLSIKLNSYAAVPAFFWASPFQFLGGARLLVGVVPLYSTSKVSLITEQRDGSTNSEYNASAEDRISGFGDMFVQPLGLSWASKWVDLTLAYGFTAPTGRYATGAPDNVGLGFWTHQAQAWGNFYPVEDQSTALVLGLTYELNGFVKDADFNPGNRFSLEWGISQYVSDGLELGIMGGHNWQVTDDRGSVVDWDVGIHDKKSTLSFTAGYWVWPARMQLTAKYAFDYACAQRFRTNFFMLNMTFITNTLTGKATN